MCVSSHAKLLGVIVITTSMAFKCMEVIRRHLSHIRYVLLSEVYGVRIFLFVGVFLFWLARLMRLVVSLAVHHVLRFPAQQSLSNGGLEQALFYDLQLLCRHCHLDVEWKFVRKRHYTL
jgi:hypothetical protein